MLFSLAAALALLVQAPTPELVRVWRTDSTLNVSLKAPGYLLLLHVDADGRISVLFPWEPDIEAWTGAEPTPLTIALPPTAQAAPATFLAVRSRWPFNFAVLRAGSTTWNYQDAWLLQATAGDPLAALLDIADRVTEGRAYEYGVIAYTRGGTVATRREPLRPDVCLGCVRRAEAVAAAAPVATQTNSVDCSNASLTNSFCGVANGNVSITSVTKTAPAAPPPPAAAPVYVPYYVPFPVVVDGAFPMSGIPPVQLPGTGSGAGGGGGGGGGGVGSGAASAFPIPSRLTVPTTAQLRTFASRPH